MEPEISQPPLNPPAPARKPTGRPRTNRKNRVVVRLTDDELAKLKEYAVINAKNPATLLRTLATRPNFSGHHNRLDRDIQKKLWQQVAGIANNINQIAKLTHQGQIRDTNAISEQIDIVIGAFLTLVGKDIKK